MQVTLKKPHTHAREEKKPGESIDVDRGTAEWLADQGVIDPIEPLPAAAGSAKPTTKKV